MFNRHWRIPAWAPRIRTLVLLAAVLLLLAVGPAREAVAQSGSIDSTQDVSAATGAEQMGTGAPLVGQRVQLTPLSSPPALTPEKIKQRELLMAKSNRPGPDVQLPAAPSNFPTGGADAAPQAAKGPSAPSDMALYRDSVLPEFGPTGAPISYSFTMEPSTGNNGKNVFQTGNWYAAYSGDNGGSWNFLDPYSIGGSWNFCCDQVTLYEPGRDVEFWLLQGDHLRLGVASGTNLTSWCVYDITSANFGQPATTEIDYNDMNVSDNNLFIASNLFPSTGGSGAGVIRMSIDALAACGQVGIGFVAWVPGGSHGWSFTWKLISGANRTMYWASDWNQGMASGSTVRVFRLDDFSNTYNWYNRTVAPFVFFKRNTGQNCATGGVTNWCQYNDSRIKGGALARNVLYFSMDAKQGGSFPFPYTRIVKFNVTGVAYAGITNKWATWGAIQYASLSPNSRGELGMAYSVGGKNSDGGNFFPTTAVALQDDFGVFSNSIIYYLFGDGNTCTYQDLLRWGDYTTIRPFWPVGDVFIATGWAMRRGDCGTQGAFPEAHNIVFGRARDGGSYYRWAPY